MNIPSPRASTALREIDRLLGPDAGPGTLTDVCRYLRREFPHYRWVGVYALRGTFLDLAAWDGPAATEHTRIPLDQGICGRAARDGRSVIVDDVRASPEYLACFLETRAEIVVPIFGPGAVVGEIDIDGNEVGAYDGSDQAFLERVASKLSGALGAMPARPG